MQITSQQPFFLQLHYCLFFREYFGNQAGLTNCSGILIWLADSTASAPPVRKNKGSFQRVSFPIIHMSRVIYHLTFRDISLKSQETFVYLSVAFHLIFNGFYSLTFFRELSLSYPIYIRLFIRLYIRLFIRLLFVSPF